MKKKVLATLLATTMIFTAIPNQFLVDVHAAEAKTLSYDGYSKVWADEFNGDTLSRDDWNVELHEKGWVNNELQEYVDSEENISVHDGSLYITPVEKVEKITVSGATNLLGENAFAGVASNGIITKQLTKADLKTNPWDCQLLQGGIKVEAGKDYVATFKASSTAERTIVAGVQKTSADYDQYGQTTVNLTSELKEYSYTFTAKVTDEAAGYYFNLGNETGKDTSESTVVISDFSLTEAPANMLSGASFGGKLVEGTIAQEVNSSNMGANPWDLQIMQNDISVEAGEKYEVSFIASSTAARTIVAGVQKTSADYDQYGQGVFNITSEPQTYSYVVDKAVNDDKAGIYFNLGKSSEGDTPESTITISNIKMVKCVESGTKVKKTYTSGRISTQNKKTYTYGLFEVRAKVPAGQGFLPAFWLMANDENIYGQWPRCGEIDCMEVMGQDTQKLYGTIHYGNPHSESQGTYTLTGSDSFSNDFHTFSCEWEPGTIKWYVDGKLYHEESDWYSTTEGQGTLTYPAPFDQPFYMILNLAVGGSWVGNPNEATSFENNPYIIDYVRVYQKDSYDENVTRPEKEITLREPNADGNFINNGDFSSDEDLVDGDDWQFMTALEGEATASIANNTMTIETSNEGTVDYSVQLVQANLPLEKGATYQVQFDAYSSADREMGVDIKAPDHGYKSYMPHKTANLTTVKQTYTYEFKMADDSDANGRLEYNMGATGSTADIYISNVSVKKIKDVDPNEKAEKTVLANGNFVYNGSFQEGANHLGDWSISNVDSAKIGVTSFVDGRRLKVAMKDNVADAVVISQTDLAFKDNTSYELSFNAESDIDNTIVARVGGYKFKADIKAGENKKFTFELPADYKYVNRNISFTFGRTGTTLLDNVSLVENALIKNGSFNAGTSGYTVYVDSSAKGSYVVDSLKDDNALAVTVENTGDQDWKVQIKQENIKLEKDKKYKLSFKAKSSLDRKIRVVMQGQENRGWSVYSSDNVIDLTNEYKVFEDEFTMNEDTDLAAFFSVCLGKIDEEITTNHEFRIDDISLVEVSASSDSGDDDENNLSDNIVTEENVKLDTSAADLPEDVILENYEYEVFEEIYDEVRELLAAENIDGKFKIFEFNLLDSEGIEIHTVSGKVTITLPIPEGLTVSDNKTIVVYRINDDGTLTKCNTVIKDGIISFETNHFSTYIFIEEDIIPDGGKPGTAPTPGKKPVKTPANTSIAPGKISSVKATAAKTGDSPIMAYVFEIMAGMLVLGSVYIRRRKNN